jgi:hypothetical protein
MVNLANQATRDEIALFIVLIPTIVTPIFLAFLCSILAFATGRLWLTPDRGLLLPRRTGPRALACLCALVAYLLYGFVLVLWVYFRTLYDSWQADLEARRGPGGVPPGGIRVCRLVAELLRPWADMDGEEERRLRRLPVCQDATMWWWVVVVEMPEAFGPATMQETVEAV